MKKIKRILIYRIGNLGDTVCAMPAMVALRQRFSEAWIGLLTNKEERSNPDANEVLKGNDFLDEIITYHPAMIREPRYLFKLLRKLRSMHIDLLAYLSVSKSTHQRLFRDWLFFRFAGCRNLIGFKRQKPTGTYKENGITIPIYLQEVNRLMSLLTPLEIDPSIIDFRLPITEKDKKTVDLIWNNYQLKTNFLIVAICIGGKFPAKQWDIDRFAEVISELQKQFNAKILLIGGPSEKALGDDLIKRTGNSAGNLIGKTNYMQSAEVISRCNLLVSNDCGPVHLAAAVGTPVVGIYSSTNNPGAWHPWGTVHTILRNDSVPCRFCFKTECETKECMNGITVEQVVEAIKRYL